MFNLKQKIQRFKNSKKLFKLAFFLHKIFGEKNVGEIGFNFDDKPKKKSNSSGNNNEKKISKLS